MLTVDRALNFLGKALSARPPDPLTLPSGFGTLSDTNLHQSTKNVCERLIAGRSLDECNCCPGHGPHHAANQKAETEADAAGGTFSELARVYDLAVIASCLMPLVTHNRHVFGPYYAEIIQSLIMPPSAPVTS